MEINVGELRKQTAYCERERRIVLITKNAKFPELANLVKRLRIVEFYPDTTDEDGKWTTPTFKIVVEIDER